MYISGMWADNPTQFNDQLVNTYMRLRQRGVSFEIVFASVDRNYKDYRLFRELMPWMCLPYGDRREALLTQRCDLPPSAPLSRAFTHLWLLLAAGLACLAFPTW